MHKVVDNLFCNLCAKPCTNKAKLRQHILTYIDKIKRLKENAGEAQIAPMKQKPDQSVLNKLSQISQELTVLPKSIKKFVCNLCRKPLSKMTNLKKHTQRCLPKYMKQDLDDLSDKENPENNKSNDETNLQSNSNLGKNVLEYHMEEEDSASPPVVSDNDSGPFMEMYRPQVKSQSNLQVKKKSLVSMSYLQSKRPLVKVTGDANAVVNNEVSDTVCGHQKKQKVLMEIFSLILTKIRLSKLIMFLLLEMSK